MFCALILLQYVKNSIYNTADNNFNTSDNSEPETEFRRAWL